MNKVLLTVLSILSIHYSSSAVFAADRIAVGTTAVTGGDVAVLPVTIENDVAIAAFSFGLIHDPALLTPLAIDYAGPIVPDFVATSSEPEGHTIGVVLDLELVNLIPAGGPRLVAFASYQVSNTATVSNFAVVTAGTVGDPPIDAEFADAVGNNISPLLVDGGIGVLQPLSNGNPATGGPVFRAALKNASTDTLRFVAIDAATGTEVSSTSFPCAGNVVDSLIDSKGLSWSATDSCGVIQIDTSGNISAEVATGANPLAVIEISGERVGVTHADGTLQVIYPDGTVLFGGDGVGDTPEDGLLGPAINLDGATAFDEYAAGFGNSSWLGGGERLVRLRPNGNIVADRVMSAGQSIVDLAEGPDGSVFVLTTSRLDHRAADGSVISTTDLLAARVALSLASIPSNASGEEEALIGVLSQGGGTDTLLTTYSTSTTGLELLADEVAFSSGNSIELAFIVALNNNPSSLINGTNANGDGTLSRVSTSGSWQQTYQGETVFINSSSSAVPVAAFFGDQDFDGDQYSNFDELLSGSSPLDALDDPTTVIPDYVAPVEGLSSIVIDDSDASGFDDVFLEWNWSSPTANNPDSFEITRFTDGVATLGPIGLDGLARTYTDLDPPPGTHYYVVVALLQGGTSASQETSVVVGAGEVEQEVPIEVPFEFTEIYDITVNPTAADDGARYYCTDSANGQIYALDANFNPVAIIASPYPEGVPCTGIIYIRTGDNNNGSLVVGNGQSGVAMRLIEITLSGEFIRDYFLFIPAPFGSKALLPGTINGSSGGMGYDESDGTMYITGQQDCIILGVAHGGSGEVDTGKTFDHPSEGSSQKGCTTKQCLVNNNFVGGCETTILLTSQTEDGTLEIIEVAVADGVATQIGEGVSLAGIEDPGGIVFEGDSYTITGNSDGTVYQVQSTGTFTRADANFDALVDIGDVVTILDYLFSGVPGPDCLASLDVNDDDAVDIGDGIYLLNALFVSGSPNPPEPFGDFTNLVSGADPTPSAVTPCP